jgi:hypothetical protein
VRDRFWAGLADTFDTQQAQLSDPNDLSAVGFSAGARKQRQALGAAVACQCAANSSGALSREALCGRTWL